ncbi:MAG TPA: MFS transporter [Acidimicrobiia bacterium]|jgi:EmrB/QacA subfamily drug resistance transporter
MRERDGGGWATVAAMSVANVVISLDFLGLTVVLPAIGRDLGGSNGTLEWIVNAYMLALAAPLVAAGRLGDLFGRRRVMTIGIAVFAAGSLAAGLAPSTNVLIGARAVQGLGAALVTATSLSIVSDAFPPERRGTAIGVWSATGAIGAAVGPLVAGFVATALSWRWLFLLNAPLAAFAAVFVLTTVRESRDETAPRNLDIAGLLSVTGGLALLVYALVEGPVRGWSSPAVVLGLVGAVALLVLFIVVERRDAAPLVDLDLFRGRAYVGTASVAFVANIAFATTMFFLTLYFQEVRDLTPAATGVAFLAFTVPLAVASPVAGWSVRRVSPAALMGFGLSVLVGSFLVFGSIDVHSRVTLALIGLFLAGIGQAFAFNVSDVAAMDAVASEKAGVASGVISGARQVGSLFGLAAAGAVFKVAEQRSLTHHLSSAGVRLTPGARHDLTTAISGSAEAERRLRHLAPTLAHEVEHLVDVLFTSAFRVTMLTLAVITAVGITGALLASSRPHRGTRAPLPPAPARR